MIEIRSESMFDILNIIQKELIRNDILEIIIPNPDLDNSTHSHSWRAWNDVATLLYCRLLTPIKISEDRVTIKLQKLKLENSFHLSKEIIRSEKYGRDSIFAKINKNEEPAFLYYYSNALKQVNISTRDTIVDLGINSGDEFEIIEKMVDEDRFKEIKLIGVDHSLSAINRAKEIFHQQNIEFYCHDINKLDSLEIPKADLIISIGTLQSPNINFKTLFMSLVQNYLTESGAIILGFPNSRWIDGEMIYGAKAPNYPFSEMSLVIKDIYFCKKYLQQHKFRVTITGKEYLFLTATRINL